MLQIRSVVFFGGSSGADTVLIAVVCYILETSYQLFLRVKRETDSGSEIFFSGDQELRL